MELPEAAEIADDYISGGDASLSEVVDAYLTATGKRPEVLAKEFERSINTVKAWRSGDLELPRPTGELVAGRIRKALERIEESTEWVWWVDQERHGVTGPCPERVAAERVAENLDLEEGDGFLLAEGERADPAKLMEGSDVCRLLESRMEWVGWSAGSPRHFAGADEMSRFTDRLREVVGEFLDRIDYPEQYDRESEYDVWRVEDGGVVRD